MSKRIVGIQCPICRMRMFSWYTHDFKYCFCGSVFADGGRDYLRCGYDPGLKVRIVYWTQDDWKPEECTRTVDRFPY